MVWGNGWVVEDWRQVMGRLRAGHARPLRGGGRCAGVGRKVSGCGVVSGHLCRGRRPRRPAEGSRPLPTMQKIKGRQRQGCGPGMPGPYGAAVNGWWAGGAREGGSPPPFPLTGCRGRLRAAYMPPLQSCRSSLRGFGGTPDSKVEEGAGALRTKSNTAFV